MRTPNRLEAACTGDDWVESPRMRCLGFDYTVRSNDAVLVHHVVSLYGACVEPGPARSRFILRRRRKPEDASVSVYRDGRAVLRNASPGLAVAHLAWEVNRGVVEEAGGRLLLHAAAAERDGNVVLIPGPQGAGKSTLVAGLVQAGLRYVTDEAVAIDPATATIEPYPKPIALDRGSLALLRAPAHRADAALEEYDGQRLVPPQSMRDGVIAPAGGRAVLVVQPAYRPDSVTAVHPMHRAEAVVALAEQSFNFGTFGSGALELVAAVVRDSRCHRLDVCHLDAACQLVLELLECDASADQ